MCITDESLAYWLMQTDRYITTLLEYSQQRKPYKARQQMDRQTTKEHQ